MTFREEILSDGVRLILGDCRVKERVGCRACNWVWRPSGNTTREACPHCGQIRDVRAREKKPNIESVKKWRASRPGYSTQWERRYRQRALMLVGRGDVKCVRCGCDVPAPIEINHKNGGGAKEHREHGRKFHRLIASLERPVDDLELLCKPCNAVHALELKHGPLPFAVVWRGSNAN